MSGKVNRPAPNQVGNQAVRPPPMVNRAPPLQAAQPPVQMQQAPP